MRERERREHEKPSQVRPSQPLGNVMTRRHKPEGKTSECSEVKDVRPESENKAPRKPHFGREPIPSGRSQATQEARQDGRRARTVPPGSQTASSYTTVGKQPGEQRARLLDRDAKQNPSMATNVKRGGQTAALRVMETGMPQWLALKWGNAHRAKVSTEVRP